MINGGLYRPPFLLLKNKKKTKGYFLEKLDVSTPHIGQVQL